MNGRPASFTCRDCALKSMQGFSNAFWEMFSTFDAAEQHLCRVGMLNWNDVQVLNKEYATSIRAEYYAALAVLEQAGRVDPHKYKALAIFTDSEVLINTMEKWASTWSRNGWVKSNGSPVKNRDLVQQLVVLGEGRVVIYRHVKARTNQDGWEYEWNDRVDRQARGAAQDADNGVW
ncbi:hypothetical protein BBJ28_00018390 [Nothophytophthora sp. Chile5]|nr:hypothetical protein BBJ28_00018390 [Nothophytophthora sp. Chile5]